MKSQGYPGRITLHKYVDLEKVGEYLFDGWTFGHDMYDDHRGVYAVIMDKVENDTVPDKPRNLLPSDFILPVDHGSSSKGT